jgi:pimeloyl-ACP methyl ester carboxylesterase
MPRSRSEDHGAGQPVVLIHGYPLSGRASVACIPTWATDFRPDLDKIDVPMLVLHGDADQVLPLDKTGKLLPGLISDLRR